MSKRPNSGAQGSGSGGASGRSKRARTSAPSDRRGSGSSSSSNKRDLLARLRSGDERIEQLERSIEVRERDAFRREQKLMMRVTAKDRKVQSLLPFVRELKQQAQSTGSTHLRACFLNPTLSNVYKALTDEVHKAEERHRLAEGDLQAWEFVRASVAGKRLVAQCKSLLEKNQQLGQQLSQTHRARLETDLALQKTYLQELESSQKELSAFVIQLDEDLEAMQSKTMILRRERSLLLREQAGAGGVVEGRGEGEEAGGGVVPSVPEPSSEAPGGAVQPAEGVALEPVPPM